MWRENVSNPQDGNSMDSRTSIGPRGSTLLTNHTHKAPSISGRKSFPCSSGISQAEVQSESSEAYPMLTYSSGESVSSSGSLNMSSYAPTTSLTISDGQSPVMSTGFIIPGSYVSYDNVPATHDNVTTNFVPASTYEAVDPISLSLDTYNMDEGSWTQEFNAAEMMEHCSTHHHPERDISNKRETAASDMISIDKALADDAEHLVAIKGSKRSTTKTSKRKSTSKSTKEKKPNGSEAEHPIHGTPRSSQERANVKKRRDSVTKKAKDMPFTDVLPGVEASSESHVVSPLTQDEDEIVDEDEEDGRQGRHSEIYEAQPHDDGLYHCYFEHQDDCNHKATKLKCNYDKYIDSHLKPYRCKVPDCASLQFSSTACRLRHEREAHGSHGHGLRPFNCLHPNCERSQSGNGFPRAWNRSDHMRRVHGYTLPSTAEDSRGPEQGQPSRPILNQGVPQPNVTDGSEETSRKRTAQEPLRGESEKRSRPALISRPQPQQAPNQMIPVAQTISTFQYYCNAWRQRHEVFKHHCVHLEGPLDMEALAYLSHDIAILTDLSTKIRHLQTGIHG